MENISDYILTLILDYVQCDREQYFALATVCKRFRNIIYSPMNSPKKTKDFLREAHIRLETIHKQILAQIDHLAKEKEDIDNCIKRMADIITSIDKNNRMYKNDDDIMSLMTTNKCIIVTYGKIPDDPYQTFVNKQCKKAKEKKLSPPSAKKLQDKWLSLPKEIKHKQYLIPCIKKLNSQALNIISTHQHLEAKVNQDRIRYEQLCQKAAACKAKRDFVESRLVPIKSS